MHSSTAAAAASPRRAAMAEPASTQRSLGHRSVANQPPQHVLTCWQQDYAGHATYRGTHGLRRPRYSNSQPAVAESVANRGPWRTIAASSRPTRRSLPCGLVASARRPAAPPQAGVGPHRQRRPWRTARESCGCATRRSRRRTAPHRASSPRPHGVRKSARDGRRRRRRPPRRCVALSSATPLAPARLPPRGRGEPLHENTGAGLATTRVLSGAVRLTTRVTACVRLRGRCVVSRVAPCRAYRRASVSPVCCGAAVLWRVRVRVRVLERAGHQASRVAPFSAPGNLLSPSLPFSPLLSPHCLRRSHPIPPHVPPRRIRSRQRPSARPTGGRRRPSDRPHTAR